MTMPHLMNCPHLADAWCLECVRELWEEYHDPEYAIKEMTHRLSVGEGNKSLAEVGYVYMLFHKSIQSLKKSATESLEFDVSDEERRDRKWREEARRQHRIRMAKEIYVALTGENIKTEA